MNRYILKAFDPREGSPVYPLGGILLAALDFFIFAPLSLVAVGLDTRYQLFATCVWIGIEILFLAGYIVCWKLRLKVKRWWQLRQAKKKGQRPFVIW